MARYGYPQNEFAGTLQTLCWCHKTCWGAPKRIAGALQIRGEYRSNPLWVPAKEVADALLTRCGYPKTRCGCPLNPLRLPQNTLRIPLKRSTGTIKHAESTSKTRCEHPSDPLRARESALQVPFRSIPGTVQTRRGYPQNAWRALPRRFAGTTKHTAGTTKTRCGCPLWVTLKHCGCSPELLRMPENRLRASQNGLQVPFRSVAGTVQTRCGYPRTRCW